MGLFPQPFIDDLRLQASILTVIQEYVPLKRAGRTYKGLCPFHSEKTPSFHVDPEKGFFHCFGCSVGGDVFKFLELHEKVGFQDAVRMLAQKLDRKSTRLNSSHQIISYAVFCLKKKKHNSYTPTTVLPT